MSDITTQSLIEVSITQALGSTPRNAGTRMWVSEDKIWGTIGGGRLEFKSIEMARTMLIEGQVTAELALPLGPTTQQCCGGHVSLAFKAVDQRNEAVPSNNSLYLHGMGHVGQACLYALAPHGWQLRSVDQRLDFKSDLKDHNLAVSQAKPGSQHLVFTHDHQLDLKICQMLLEKADQGWIGLIGSKSKKVRFFRQLRAMNLDPNLINCPIGLALIEGKEPETIAASVTAELLVLKSRNALPPTLVEA